ncbi:VOC family protein [bacterium]|nr:VOC family protein [bacterium]
MAAEVTSALIPHLVVNGAAKAVEFYQAAFAAEVGGVMPDPTGSGRVMHAHVKILGADLFLCDDFPEHCGGVARAPQGASPVTLHLCVANADAAIAKAAAAGATVTMPADDMFWGDRYGKVTDPFGHEWSFTHPLTAEQTAAAQARWAEFMKQQAPAA